MPRVVLLTGASVGLGLAIARALLRTRYHVILTARPSSMYRFKDAGITEGPRIWLRPLDVTDATARRAIVSEANRILGGIDVLINNAGFAYRAVAEDMELEEVKAQMSVNFWAPIELSRLVLPVMRRKRRGHIIHISSVSGMMAMPTMGAYSASKHALEGASEALWYEVRPWNIRVSLVQPGFIRSDGFKKVRFTQRGLDTKSGVEKPYYSHYVHMEILIERLMGLAWATPEHVAHTVIRTMNQKAPPLRVPATMDAVLFSAIKRLLPRKFYHFILYNFLPKIRRWGPYERRRKFGPKRQI